MPQSLKKNQEKIFKICPAWNKDSYIHKMSTKMNTGMNRIGMIET